MTGIRKAQVKYPGRAGAIAAGYRASTTAQSIPNNTATTVTLTGTSDFDWGGLSIASSIVTIAQAGVYDISAGVYFTFSATAGKRVVGIETWTGADPGVNLGTQIAWSNHAAASNADSGHSLSTKKYLAAGAKVRLFAVQVSGASMNLLNNFGYPPYLNLALI